jgi:hypothetical protein
MPALGPAAEVFAPGIPRGDAGPSVGAPGVTDIVCAAAAPQLNRTARIAIVENRRMETSCRA